MLDFSVWSRWDSNPQPSRYKQERLTIVVRDLGAPYRNRTDDLFITNEML
jgi:hypothetical protein